MPIETKELSTFPMSVVFQGSKKKEVLKGNNWTGSVKLGWGMGAQGRDRNIWGGIINTEDISKTSYGNLLMWKSLNTWAYILIERVLMVLSIMCWQHTY